jgi:uncharacterized membrane protein
MLNNYMKNKAILLIILSTFLITIGQFFLKKGIEESFSLLTIYQNYFLILGIIFYFTSSLIFIIALNYADLSLLYPFYALSFVWITLISIFVFNETIKINNGIGIFMIIIGVSLLGLKND